MPFTLRIGIAKRKATREPCRSPGKTHCDSDRVTSRATNSSLSWTTCPLGSHSRGTVGPEVRRPMRPLETGETNPSGLTTRIERWTWSRIRSVVLPMTRPGTLVLLRTKTAETKDEYRLRDRQSWRSQRHVEAGALVRVAAARGRGVADDRDLIAVPESYCVHPSRLPGMCA